MTQYGYEPLSPDDSGSTLLERLNGVVPALLTNHKGAARPGYVQPGMMWIDDSGSEWQLNLFDGTSDVAIAAIDPDTHQAISQWVPATRTITSGLGVKINGGESATFAGPVTIGLDLATDAETVAGEIGNKPAPPSGVHAAIAAALGSISAIEPGMIGYTAAQSPPAGWLERNGAAISRAAYAALFAKIGTTFGAGDGSTTFNLPDARGTFDRGWDHGRGQDPGRVFGSYQADEFKSHTHTIQRIVTGGIVVEGVSTISQTPNGSFASNSTGGTETRPKNIAGLPIIKY